MDKTLCQFVILLVLLQGGKVLSAIDNCPQYCPKIYDPKCASDDKTYDNVCEMSRAQCTTGVSLRVKYDGKCGEPAGCPTKCNDKDIKPVCGSDGITYPNKCIMQKVFCESKGSIAMAKEGRCDCPPDAPPIPCLIDFCKFAKCPRIPSALCLTSNCGTCTVQFFLGRKRLSFCDCHHCDKPVVKKTCKDPCQFGFCAEYPGAICRPDKKDECKPSFYFSHSKEAVKNCGVTCSEACTREFFPICGTDDVTYGNPCLMNKEKCKSDGKVGVKHNEGVTYYETGFVATCIVELSNILKLLATNGRKPAPIKV